jgi:hypothetical protein
MTPHRRQEPRWCGGIRREHIRKSALDVVGVLLLLSFGAGGHAQSSYQYDLPGNLVAQGSANTGPPIILRQPATQVVSAGGNGSFSVVVADTAAVTYQWRFNGANLGGATADSLLLTNVSAASEGNYSVVVANGSGSVTSTPAMLWWDSVGDGIPDSWKIQYFGSITNLTAYGDPHHDGVSNLEKFQEGTNPTNDVGLLPRLAANGLNGFITGVPNQDKFTLGQMVILTAVPNPGFAFVGWSGDLTGTNNPAILTMDRTKTVTAVCSLPLPYVLDTTNIIWRSGGDVAWFGQDYVSYDGVAAAQNGPLWPGQVSWLEAAVYMSRPGLITFWWKQVASPGSSLTLTINGVATIQQISGSDWTQIAYYLPAGTSLVRWTYQKNSEPTAGFDAVWVDQVVATPYSDPLADSDFDGLPDLWEYRYFGSLLRSGTDDSDSDKVNNHDEYLDGTDPTILSSVSPRLSTTASGGTVVRSPDLPQYSYLQPVTLTATANAGFSFMAWAGDLTGTTNPGTLTMNVSKSVSAWFGMTAPTALATAIDATNLVVSTGGDIPWFGQTLETHDGVDAAHSGPLGTNSWMETTVNGPGTLSFWWKTTASFSELRFLTNGVQQQKISGIHDWQQLLVNLPAGSTVVRWAFVKSVTNLGFDDAGLVDQVVFGTTGPSIIATPTNQTVLQGSNASFTVTATSTQSLSYRWQKNGLNLTDGGNVSGAATTNLTLSNVQTNDSGVYSVVVSTAANTVSSAASLTVVALVPLPQALDTPSWVWNSGGTLPWFGQNLVSHDGSAAAQSGSVAFQQESWVETTVTGPGALQFWWKASCVQGLGRLDFILNGSTNATISGEVDWVPRSMLIPSGTSTVRWRYFQGSSSSTPQKAWLDQVAFVAGVPPTIDVQPVSQTVAAGTDASFTVTASGTGPLSYQWFFNRTNLVGLNSATLTLPGVQLASSGSYSVQVTNALGKVMSADAQLVVLPVGVSNNLTLSITISNGVARMSWGALAGRSYQVQYTTNLLVSAWSNLPPMITATNSQAVATDPIGYSQSRFYRVTLLGQ